MLDQPDGSTPRPNHHQPVIPDRARRRPPTLERKPKVAPLAVDAYAIFDHADPDRAGPWIDSYEPDDPDAAYLVDLYETPEQARAGFGCRARRIAREIHPSWGEARVQPIVDDIESQLTVRRVTTREGMQGRDYRWCDCDDLPDYVKQIRRGERGERAWREILRQRSTDDVDGALLPGDSPAGTLFVFITAGGLDVSAPL